MRMGFIVVVILALLLVGCSGQQESAVQEVEWDTIPPAEQAIEVTVSDAAWDHMAADWGAKTSHTSLFMLVPGSS